MAGAKILFVDIETMYMLVRVWQSRLYNISISKDQIKRDMFIMSFAYKWLGDKEVQYFDQSKVRPMSNDKPLLKKLWKLFDEADIVIAHNGRAFDVKTINGRMFANGMTPPSPFRQVDTYVEVGKHFNLTKKSLEYIAEVTGCKRRKIKHKEFAGFRLWDECEAGNPKAWRAMKEYNCNDVLVLEEIYLKMRPWMNSHPNLGIFVDSENPVCPNCGGTVAKRGERVTVTNYGRYQQYYCRKCKKYPRSRVQLAGQDERRRQMAG